MNTQEPGERLTTVAVYVVLFVLGLLQGAIGSFQYGRSPVPLIALVLVAIIFATCLLGGWGTRSVSGGIVPALGWFIASFVLSAGSSQGTVIITASAAGEWYLYGGALACIAGSGIVFIRTTLYRGRTR